MSNSGKYWYYYKVGTKPKNFINNSKNKIRSYDVRFILYDHSDHFDCNISVKYDYDNDIFEDYFINYIYNLYDIYIQPNDINKSYFRRDGQLLSYIESIYVDNEKLSLLKRKYKNIQRNKKINNLIKL